MRARVQARFYETIRTLEFELWGSQTPSAGYINAKPQDGVDKHSMRNLNSILDTRHGFKSLVQLTQRQTRRQENC